MGAFKVMIYCMVISMYIFIIFDKTNNQVIEVIKQECTQSEDKEK